MSNETTIKVAATPEWLAEQVVQRAEKTIILTHARGALAAHIDPMGVSGPRGQELSTIRAWLVEQIEGAYSAGVASVAQAKGQEPSTQAVRDGAAHLDAAVREGLIDSWSHLGTRDAFISFHGHGVDVPIPLHIASAVVSIIRKAKQQARDAVAQTKADGAAALVETYGPDALAKAREEGRRQGWEEVIARFDDKAIEHADTCDKKLWEANSMRVQAARLSEEARVQQETAKMAHAVADELRAAAPKEPA